MSDFIKKMSKVERLGTATAKFPVQTPSQNIWPGLMVCSVIGLICLIEGMYFPAISANLLAVLLGFMVRNLITVPQVLEPGIGVATKRVLRWGVALLGLQVSLTSVLALGWGLVITDLLAVGTTFIVTLIIGRFLKIDEDLVLLISAGFSICGAAAVAGFQGTVKAKEEKVAAAVALVVLFGTIMIAIGPLLIHVLGFATGNAATLIGGSTHEVAQVAAAAGIAGGGLLLTTAIVVKLFRVALMAPIVFLVGLVRQKRSKILIKHQDQTLDNNPVKYAAPLPLFVVGFVVLMLFATLNVIPKNIGANIKLVQQFFLTTAMFGLGLGVHLKSLRKLGLKPILLGLCSTLIILAVVLTCISLGLGAHL